MNKWTVCRCLSGSAAIALLSMLFCPFAAEARSDAEAVEATNDVVELPPRCRSDDECVPAAVCHPTKCVHRLAPRPDVGACTFECRPGTLDCGQGHCECFARRCVAVIE
jgi:hypothetical protein